MIAYGMHLGCVPRGVIQLPKKGNEMRVRFVSINGGTYSETAYPESVGRKIEDTFKHVTSYVKAEVLDDNGNVVRTVLRGQGRE